MWVYSGLKKSRKKKWGEKGGRNEISDNKWSSERNVKQSVDWIEKGGSLGWDEKTDVTWTDKEWDMKYQ